MTIHKILIAAAGCAMMLTACSTKENESQMNELTTVGNPYLPLWEHIPDGEPYVFEDPDQPGKYRVYIRQVNISFRSLLINNKGCPDSPAVYETDVGIHGSRKHGSHPVSHR